MANLRFNAGNGIQGNVGEVFGFIRGLTDGDVGRQAEETRTRLSNGVERAKEGAKDLFQRREAEDLNRDGQVTDKEKQTYRNMDLNGDGKVGTLEKRKFERLDKDNNGSLSQAERAEDKGLFERTKDSLGAARNRGTELAGDRAAGARQHLADAGEKTKGFFGRMIDGVKDKFSRDDDDIPRATRPSREDRTAHASPRGERVTRHARDLNGDGDVSLFESIGSRFGRDRDNARDTTAPRHSRDRDGNGDVSFREHAAPITDKVREKAMEATAGFREKAGELKDRVASTAHDAGHHHGGGHHHRR